MRPGTPVLNEGHSRSGSTNTPTMTIPIPSPQDAIKLLSPVATTQTFPQGPGGVLAHTKWNILEEDRVNLDTASQVWPGVIENVDGKRKFIIDVSAFPKSEVKRQEVIHELITTEQEYVRDLRIIINVFESNMKSMGIVSEDGLKTIFSNIETLAITNEEFLNLLYQRKERDFGIVQEADAFRVYNTYCSNQPAAVKFLQERKTSDLGIFIQFCAMKPEARGLDLSSFLLKPVQRICKYPLLLRELMKNTTPKHSDFKWVEKAIQSISGVVDYVNEKRREHEQQQALTNLLGRLEFTDTLLLPRNPSRYIVHEGVLYKAVKSSVQKVMSSQRWIVLFNDCLVMAKPAMFSNGKHQVNAIFSIWSISVANIEDTEKLKNVFQIKIDGKKTFMYSVPTASEKKQWMNMFTSALEAATKMLQSTPSHREALKGRQRSLTDEIKRSTSIELDDEDEDDRTFVSRLGSQTMKRMQTTGRAKASSDMVARSNDQLETTSRITSTLELDLQKTRRKSISQNILMDLKKPMKIANPEVIDAWDDSKGSIDSQDWSDSLEDVRDAPTAAGSMLMLADPKPSSAHQPSKLGKGYSIGSITADLFVTKPIQPSPPDKGLKKSGSYRTEKMNKSGSKLALEVETAIEKAKASNLERIPTLERKKTDLNNMDSVKSKFLKNNGLTQFPNAQQLAKSPLRPSPSTLSTHIRKSSASSTGSTSELVSPVAAGMNIRARIAELVANSNNNLKDAGKPTNPSQVKAPKPPEAPAPQGTIRNKINELRSHDASSNHSRAPSYELSSAVRPSAIKKTGTLMGHSNAEPRPLSAKSQASITSASEMSLGHLKSMATLASLEDNDPVQVTELS